jgi:hypothetical protein
VATADELKTSLNSFFTSEDANTIAGYKTQYILQLINNKTPNEVLNMVCNFLTDSKPSRGFNKLFEASKKHIKTKNGLDPLKFSLEAYIVENPKFHNLFNDNAINKAKERLAKYKHTPQI